ncbi:hypothetical protein GIB67_009232 [Kingdonia uniflora]|uniref:Transposase n=1 Tax=Kingdonia uniflora TaxID=39325 RepID=A0A7J7N2H2_9MAGN|nr:hypothetical protein GIB67_009232 [Kingdonia uniflora]
MLQLCYLFLGEHKIVDANHILKGMLRNIDDASKGIAHFYASIVKKVKHVSPSHKRKKASYLSEEELDELPNSSDSDIDSYMMNLDEDDIQTNDVQEIDDDVQSNIDVNNVDVEEHYYNTHSSQNEDGVPTAEDITKYQEFKDFVGENSNIFEKDENMAVLDSRQVGNCIDPIVIGMELPTINEARSYIRTWFIQSKFTYYIKKKNKSYRLRFKCTDKTCDSVDKNKLANALWVANYCEDELRNIKLSMPIDVFTTIRRKFGIDLSYWTAWNAWTICMEMIVGSYDEGYFKMPSLVRELIIVNPRNIIGYSRDNATLQWTRTAVMFKTSYEGWLRGYKPVLGLDRCFLKGKYGEVCLFVIGADKNYFTATKDGQRWIINLNAQECECKEWQIFGLPYVHAVCILVWKRRPWKYEYYWVSIYMKAYANGVYPMADGTSWVQMNSLIQGQGDVQSMDNMDILKKTCKGPPVPYKIVLQKKKLTRVDTPRTQEEMRVKFGFSTSGQYSATQTGGRVKPQATKITGRATPQATKASGWATP